MSSLLAAVLLAACCLAPACHRPADPDLLLAVSEQPGDADLLLAASEEQGQRQRPLNSTTRRPGMADSARTRLLRAVRVLVAHPAGPDAQALLAAVETVLGEREAEVRAEAAVEALNRAADALAASETHPGCIGCAGGVAFAVDKVRRMAEQYPTP